MSEKVNKTEEEWRQQLTPEQFRVLRQKGTEPAFTGVYWNEKREGRYHCAACDAPLFSSETKYDSGSGWPSFQAPIDASGIKAVEDLSYGMRRIEVLCAACDSHLGHVFPDGPGPGGMRYCINSVSLDLKSDA